MYVCSYIKKESVQNKGPMGFKIWKSWNQFSQKPVGSAEVCAQKPKGSREQCVQKQSKPLRGPATEASLFLFRKRHQSRFLIGRITF